MNEVLKPLLAYWVYAKDGGTVSLHYNPGSPRPSPVRLAKGWNLLGIYGQKEVPARDALASIQKEWVQALGFNASSQAFDPAIINGGSGIYSDGRTMLPLQGYWVLMNDEGVYSPSSS